MEPVKTHQESDQPPDVGGDEPHLQQLPLADKNKVVAGRVVEIFAGIVLGSVSAVLFDSGYHRLGDLCMFLAILCGIHLAGRFFGKADAGRVRQWSIAAVIAAAAFSIFFAHGPDIAAPKPTDMLSKPNAEEVIGRYDQAIPMQQNSVASGFVGVPVIWKLDLRKATEDQGVIHLVLIASHNRAASSDIRMDVREKGNEFLKMANRDDSFVIKGNILKVSDSGIDMAPGGTILPAK